jgi:hypothetical protein
MKKTITIRDLEDTLDKRIREKAKALNLSLDKTVKTLLKDSLGGESSIKQIEKRKREFMDLFGAWTQTDLEEFCESEADLSGMQLQDSS